MTVRLVEAGWGAELTAGLDANADRLWIVCPFIKDRAVGRLLIREPSDIRVITRFNLADFAQGVSDLSALARLLDAGAQVRGIRDLHAKLYLFADRAIVTSANLTQAGLDTNREFGMVADEPSILRACETYFEGLWQRGGPDLTQERLEAWDRDVTAHRVRGGRSAENAALPDHGVEVGSVETLPVILPIPVGDAPQAFVKFLGSSHHRAPLDRTTFDEVNSSGCHWAVGYPAAQHPAIVNDDDLLFLGRLTANPNDITIFGRAIGMAHVPGRDEATPEDIARRGWAATWSNYIRVHSAEFVAGTLANGVSLNEMMDALGPDSFATTQNHAAQGNGNTDPRRTYRQQPAVRLSAEGQIWLATRLQAAFDRYGTIPSSRMEGLDWPTLPMVAP